MYVVGLDIGYSNLKLVMGDAYADSPTRSVVMPAGAGPISYMPQRLGGDERTKDFVRVLVGGKEWVAGVEPGRLQAVDRELHKDYFRTNAYEALFHAGLLQSDRAVIDHLVTGLPVYQYQDNDAKLRVQKCMTGTHNPIGDKMVKVNKVSVLPQPAGAYLDLVRTFDDIALLDEGRVLIIDPGFFSVDWVTLEGGEIRSSSSGTSLKAVSVLLEKVNQLIAEEHDGRVGIDQLEKALRRGTSKVLLFGNRVDVKPYLDKAVESVAAEALTSLRQAMRTDDKNIDVVMIAGGGAEAYRHAVSEIFPKSRIFVPTDPVLSNARGFWSFGA